MKKVNAFILILGVLLGIISGTIFAGESTPADQNGIVSGISVNTDVQASPESDVVYGPEGLDEPGGLCGPAGSGGQGGLGSSGGLSDMQYPLVMMLVIVAVMLVLM
jgi:hypothetical protein